MLELFQYTLWMFRAATSGIGLHHQCWGDGPLWIMVDAHVMARTPLKQGRQKPFTERGFLAGTDARRQTDTTGQHSPFNLGVV